MNPRRIEITAWIPKQGTDREHRLARSYAFTEDSASRKGERACTTFLSWPCLCYPMQTDSHCCRDSATLMATMRSKSLNGNLCNKCYLDASSKFLVSRRKLSGEWGKCLLPRRCTKPGHFASETTATGRCEQRKKLAWPPWIIQRPVPCSAWFPCWFEECVQLNLNITNISWLLKLAHQSEILLHWEHGEWH